MFPRKPKNKRLVYLDHAATTYVDKMVVKAMEPYYFDIFGNPSGLYKLGREANGVLNDSRCKVAELLGALPDNIIFTGSGTESDNMAIFGVTRKYKNKGKHIITTKIEHHAVLHPMKQLEKEGYDIIYLEPNEFGLISVKQIKKAIRKDTILISIIYANNEIGTVEPIADIGRLILKWRKENNTEFPYFHTDACQATGALELNVEKLHVDLMTINGSKIYGPKGVGCLYKRRCVDIEPLIYGGTQEFNLRAGTENVPSIVGFSKALELAQNNKEIENQRLIELRNYFWEKIKMEIPKVVLNGPSLSEKLDRLPNNLNVSFLDIEGEAMLLYLDEYGIVCSTGSACTSSSLEASHVLIACGRSHEYAHGSLRFTLGKRTTKKDIDYVMKYLPGIVEKLREISPVNLK